jgi:hypothetical protein
VGQDLKNLLEVTVTLKTGVQASILVPQKEDIDIKSGLKLRGYEAQPLMVNAEDIAMIEMLNKPHIVWGDAIPMENQDGG